MGTVWKAALWLTLTAAVVAAQSADDAIDRYIRSEMELNSIPGLGLAIVDGGEISTRAYGVASTESGRPMTVETPVDLASVSKSLTAVGILQLEHEGLLRRDQPVTAYLPEMASPSADPGWRNVTISHLLRHRSGLRRPADFLVPCCGQLGDGDLDIAASRIAEARLESRAGAVFSYANANYILLAALIERISGRPFANFMQERVFDALGMTAASLDRTRAQRRGLAAPHEWRWGRVRVSSSRFYGWLGASLVKASAADMGRYLRALLGAADAGAPPALGNDWWSGLERGYDLGWYVQTEAYWLDGGLGLEHAGDIWGGNTAALLVPERKAGTAVLTNVGTNRANRIARAVMRRISGLDMPAPQRTAASESPDNWAMGFLAVSALVFAGLTGYLVRFVRQWTGGRREWAPSGWRTARALLLGALAVAPLYMLFRAAPPLTVFPSTVKLTLPLLVLGFSAVLLVAGIAGLTPKKKTAGQGR